MELKGSNEDAPLLKLFTGGKGVTGMSNCVSLTRSLAKSGTGALNDVSKVVIDGADRGEVGSNKDTLSLILRFVNFLFNILLASADGGAPKLSSLTLCILVFLLATRGEGSTISPSDIDLL